MAKQRYDRTRPGTRVMDDDLQVETLFIPPSLNEDEEIVTEVDNEDEIGAIATRRDGESIDLYVAQPDKTYKKVGGGVADTALGQGLVVSEGAITLDLESKTLVSPTIVVSWSLFQSDGETPYSPAISSSKALVVDKGVIAHLVARYSYSFPNGNQALPQSVSGSFGAVLPPPATNSPNLTDDDVTANKDYSVVLAKPRSGLVVSGSQVSFPSGNDTMQDSANIRFRTRGYFGYSADAVLTGVQIIELGNGAFQTSRVRTFTNVTAGAGLYTYYCYEADFGALSGVLFDGAEPALGSFSRLDDVVVINAAGFAVPYIVYRSNSTQAFNGNSLAFS